MPFHLSSQQSASHQASENTYSRETAKGCQKGCTEAVRCLTIVPDLLNDLTNHREDNSFHRGRRKDRLRGVLESEGYATALAVTGEDGFYRLSAEALDAVLWTGCE